MGKWLSLSDCCCFLFFFMAPGLAATAQQQAKVQTATIFIENDFFNLRGEGTDRGYTSGLQLTFTYTKERPRIWEKLLLRPSDTVENRYSYRLTQATFTPDDISRPEIIRNDRPYAGCLYLTNALTSSDGSRNRKLTTAFSLGVLGKYSFSQQTQNFIHRLVRYKQAKGWKNQIASDVILSYFLNYEQLLAQVNRSLEIFGNIQGNAGTLYNNMGLGIQLRTGMLNDYFTNSPHTAARRGAGALAEFKKIHFFLFMKALGYVVMDDATLEGGFFSHNKSPYTIKKDDLKRVCLQYSYGFVLEKWPLRLAFLQTVTTPEFKDDYSQQTGSISLQLGF